MSHVMRKPTLWFSNRFDTNRAVQAQKMARSWKLKTVCTIIVAETNMLICVFVFPYADCWFPSAAAKISGRAVI